MTATLSTFAPLLQDEYSRNEPGEGRRRKKGKKGKRGKRRVVSSVNKSSRIARAMGRPGSDSDYA